MIPLVSQCNTLLFVSIWTVYRTASVSTWLNTKQGHGDVRNVPKPKAWFRHSVQISDRRRWIKAAVYYMIVLEKCLVVVHICICGRACGYSEVFFLGTSIYDVSKVWCHLTWSIAGLRESIQRSITNLPCEPLTKWNLTKMERHNLVGTKTSRSHSSLLHLYLRNLNILYRWTTAPRCIHIPDSAQQSLIPVTFCNVVNWSNFRQLLQGGALPL